VNDFLDNLAAEQYQKMHGPKKDYEERMMTKPMGRWYTPNDADLVWRGLEALEELSSLEEIPSPLGKMEVSKTLCVNSYGEQHERLTVDYDFKNTSKA
tara:strand:+ start:181 stop:474 length:294 start_codon:yes stop_codon:yes gene_type:complete